MPILAILAAVAFSIQAVLIAVHESARPGIAMISREASGRLTTGEDGRDWGPETPGDRALAAVAMIPGVGVIGVLSLQIALATGAAERLSRMGRALGGSVVGWLPVSLHVFNPDRLVWHSHLGGDLLYTSVLILTLAAAHAAWSCPTPRALGVGMAWGLVAGLLMPVGYLVIPIVLGAWSVRWWRTALAPRRAACLAAISALTGIFLLLPLVRQATLAGQDKTGRQDRGVVVRDFEESWLPMPMTAEPIGSGLGSGLAYAAAHPRACLHLAALRVLATLAHVRPYESTWHNITSLGVLIPLYALAALGLAATRHQVLSILLAAVIAVHLLVVALTGASWSGHRLHWLLPLVAVLAARGVAGLGWPRRMLLPTVVIALLLALFHGPVLTGFARLFRVDDPATSDALVLLLGGGPDRAEKAAELYQHGLGPRILVGSDPDLGWNRDALRARHVPAQAIVSLGPTIGTREEAWRVRDHIAAHPEIRRITVVTTAFHTARARWIFQRILSGTGVDVRTAASDDPRFDETDWYTASEGIQAYSQEVVKVVFAYLADVH